MTALDAPPFTAHGVFAGFFRDIFGKRRMVLREGSHEAFLKVSKALRRELGEALSPGQEVTVTGHRDPADGRRVVTSVQPAGAAAVITSPILVCSRKSCWRNGGHAVWAALEHGLAAGGLTGHARLRAVDCLGHCKQGPNVEWAGQTFHRCQTQDVSRILEAINESSL